MTARVNDLTTRARAALNDPRMTRELRQWLIEMEFGHATYHGIDRHSHRMLQDLGLAQKGDRVQCTKLGREAYRLLDESLDESEE